jgi:hypothetical protein
VLSIGGIQVIAPARGVRALPASAERRGLINLGTVRSFVRNDTHAKQDLQRS